MRINQFIKEDGDCCAPLELWTGGLVRWIQETH